MGPVYALVALGVAYLMIRALWVLAIRPAIRDEMEMTDDELAQVLRDSAYRRWLEQGGDQE